MPNQCFAIRAGLVELLQVLVDLGGKLVAHLLKSGPQPTNIIAPLPADDIFSAPAYMFTCGLGSPAQIAQYGLLGNSLRFGRRAKLGTEFNRVEIRHRAPEG